MDVADDNSARHFYNEADNMSWRVLPDGKVQFWAHVHSMWVDDSEGHTLEGFEGDPDVRETAPRHEPADPPVSPITDDTISAGAAAIADLLTMLGVDPDERIEGDDVPPVGRMLAELVLQACTAVGAPAAVVGVTGDMKDAATRAAIRIHRAWQSQANRDAYVGNAIEAAAQEAVREALGVRYGDESVVRAATAGTPVDGITDDMVEAALQAVVALGCGERDDRCDPDCSCREFDDDKDRADCQLFVRTVLSAALAGCTVVPVLDGEERDFVAQAMEAAEAGSAGHWPTVAAVLRDEVLRLRAVAFELPEPDGTSIEGDPLWSAHVDYEETIFACVDKANHPVVEGPFSDGPMAAVTAEMFGLRLLAAAREARRLAGGSQVGDQHGDA